MEKTSKIYNSCYRNAEELHEGGSTNLPTHFSLEQNYPNPFNPTTNFEFRIANFGSVSLKVFNLLGQEVATLVSEERSAGNYSVQWDASALPSGLYFYQLESGAFIDTKKLILLR